MSGVRIPYGPPFLPSITKNTRYLFITISINYMRMIKKIYFKIFDWLVDDKVIKSVEKEERIHLLLLAMLTTSALMWSYTLCCYFSFEERHIFYVSLVFSTVHFLSPLVYKYTNSVVLGTHVFIFSGFCFQYMHSFYTGGFYSNTLIWFSVLPLIGGLVIGSINMLIWSMISILGVLSLFYFNEHTSNIIMANGKLWSQLNISIGYIILNSVIMMLYIYFRESHKKLLSDKNEAIKKLLRIVSHDIANPLMIVIANSFKLKRKTKGNEDLLKVCDSIEKATLMVLDILDHVRNLEAIESGKQCLNIEKISLNEIIENSLFVFKTKIEKKNIKINYDFKKNDKTYLMAESISIKNQVFNNLFSNSIKFMDSNGKIDINVSVEENRTIVKLKDTGIGMDEELIENLFRSDIKTSRMGNEGEVGTGFGMPIVRAIMNEIGARIDVISIAKIDGVTNHGTEFILNFENEKLN
jgi:signal transduction histidine kinase